MNAKLGPIAGLLLDVADLIVSLRDWRFVRSSRFGKRVAQIVNRLYSVRDRLDSRAQRFFGLLFIRLPWPLLVIVVFIGANLAFFFVLLPTLLFMFGVLIYFLWYFLPLTLVAYALRLAAAFPAVFGFAVDYVGEIVKARREWYQHRSDRINHEEVGD
jgi:hypothetical protein